MYRDLKKDIVGNVSRCLNCQQVKCEHQKPGGLTRRLIKSAHFIPVMTSYISDKLAQSNSGKVGHACGVKHYISIADGWPVRGDYPDPEDMLRAHMSLYEALFGRRFVLLLVSLSLSIQISPHEALYGRRFRSPIGWLEPGEAMTFGTDLVCDALEKVKLIKDRL
nr:uncharacterized protein LOC117279812 [Nicotiana tomentosiformis]